jgi:cysteine desulfurase
MRPIYLDYNATSALDPSVLEVMLPFYNDTWGNPSSVHQIGRRARASLDDARDRISLVFKCKPSEVVFTSGGTESNNLALIGSARHLKEKGKHIVTSQIEHHAVLHGLEYLEEHEGFDITKIPVDYEGRVDPEDIKRRLREDTILVSVMAANNEIGTIQPVAEIGALCRERGILFHTDAVQWFGKETFKDIHQFNADLVSICAHKLHGPKGAGALYVRSPLLPDPILFGGGHENERRAGTENLPGIIGLAEVVERFVREPVFPSERLWLMTRRLENSLKKIDGVQLASPSKNRLANTVSFLVRGADSIALLANLDMEGVCASSGSACTAGSLQPSHVIESLGVDRALANSLVRFSLGRETTDSEIEEVERLLPEVIARAQSSQ